MPPKVQIVLRGPSRKAAAAEDAPVASPAKRGRPAKANTSGATETAAGPPKKRGRPAKATTQEAAPIEDASAPKKRGRKSMAAPEPAVEAVTPKRGRGMAKDDTAPPTSARRGRPPKEAIADAAPTPRKRGRPAKGTGLDLSKVAGTPRVGKRTPARSQTTKTVTTAARIDPRMRSKLRTRLPPATKVTQEEPAPKPARRGRPPKNAVKTPGPKKAAGRKAAEAPVAKSKPAKPTAPRRMRGHTLRQIPDRYITQVDQLLHDLMEADAAAAPAEEEEEAQDVEIEVEVEAEAEAEAEGEAGEDELNIEPISPTVGDEQYHDAEGAVEQYSEGVTEAPAQSEATFDENAEPEQDMEFDVDEQVDAPMEQEDGITPTETEVPGAVYEHSSEDQALSSMQGQESSMHAAPVPNSAVMV